MGTMTIPPSTLWGCQTQRSLQNFPIGGPSSKMPLEIVKAQAVVKKCCAKYNKEKGKVDGKVADAIVWAADEVIEGKLDQHFPLCIYQTGENTVVTRARSYYTP